MIPREANPWQYTRTHVAQSSESLPHEPPKPQSHRVYARGWPLAGAQIFQSSFTLEHSDLSLKPLPQIEAQTQTYHQEQMSAGSGWQSDSISPR